ncbi:MAG: helix-turn-helix domain-containing protein [Acidobacteria bacterium]|nr:helix-turn-helix domain-containing protein [Acidobacteriota bacterium]
MAKRAINKRGVATTEGLDTIAQRLVRLRKERGLTQAQMAARLGVSQPVVSDYERGGLRLHGELILKVAEILDVSANELLGLDTKAAPKKRGPQSQLEKRMAAIATLPRKEQQQLLAVVEAFINQHATR